MQKKLIVGCDDVDNDDDNFPPDYPFGIRISRRVDGRRLATFNARNEHDRCKFAEDLRESVAEMDDMESMRIEGELNRGKGRNNNNNRNGE